MQPAVQVSLSIDHARYRAIADRAAVLGYKPSRYIGMLVDAAYLARVTREKGVEPEDRELDSAVQRVFLLADCEPEFIAQATGLAQSLVEKILDGWRTIGAELAVRPALPKPQDEVRPDRTVRVDPSVAAEEKKAASRAEYPAEQISEMWAAGRSLKEIAGAIGKTAGALSMWLSKHRDICPHRVKPA